MKIARLQRRNGQIFEYDALVLALGMVTNYFNIAGIEEFAYGIKTLEDAEALKKHLHKHIVTTKHLDLNYVVIGGGPTGIELAGALGAYIKYISANHGITKRSIHVDLIEAAPRLAARMPKDISKMIQRQLQEKKT